MKLRITENSLRLRLSSQEVLQLAQRGRIAETIEFGSEDNQKLIYELKIAAESESVNARFENGRITVFVTEAAAFRWTNSEQIAIETAQPLGAGRSLRILIEKDFADLKA